MALASQIANKVLACNFAGQRLIGQARKSAHPLFEPIDKNVELIHWGYIPQIDKIFMRDISA